MQTFCTIITPDFLPFAKVLLASLKKYDANIQLVVLFNTSAPITKPHDGFIFFEPKNLETSPFLKDIEKKYAHTNPDHFRWALKPVFIHFLLEKGYDKVIYIDPDIFFVGDYSFLFKKLDEAAVLLTPHWRDANPLDYEENFITLFKDGLYNAGFIGASTKGKEAINWWAGLCSYKIEKNLSKGLFDDQRYLDAMPVMFTNIEVLKHKGCNISYWNMNVSKREIINNKLTINKAYEPVFIHFTKDTIVNILNRNDNLLRPYLDEYFALLQSEGVDTSKAWGQLNEKKYSTQFYTTKHKLRLRTRLKRFFFKLSEKL